MGPVDTENNRKRVMKDENRGFGMGICIGAGIGILVGAIFNIIPFGMTLGSVIGAVSGIIYDNIK